MDEVIQKKLEELQLLIEKSTLFQEAKRQKEVLLLDQNLLREIQLLRSCSDTYSEEYLKRKRKLFENNTYHEYQKLENDLYILSLQINQILNRLTKKEGGCSYENH